MGVRSKLLQGGYITPQRGLYKGLYNIGTTIGVIKGGQSESKLWLINMSFAQRFVLSQHDMPYNP